jgi:hypothetical protein
MTTNTTTLFPDDLLKSVTHPMNNITFFPGQLLKVLSGFCIDNRDNMIAPGDVITILKIEYRSFTNKQTNKEMPLCITTIITGSGVIGESSWDGHPFHSEYCNWELVEPVYTP